MIGLPKHIPGCLVGFLLCSVLVTSVCSGEPGRKKRVESTNLLNGKPVSALNPSTRDWVKKELVKGRSVILTNSYLFQVMKGAAQENQKAVEQTVLIPVLEQTLRGLVKAASDDNARRLFGTPLAILAEDPEVELSEDIRQQAQEIKSHPMFVPRGHYAESEALQRYFVAMQYLAKATVDVAVKKESFPFPKSMLFPFETALAVQKMFSDPANKEPVEMWLLVHSFYSDVNGPSDLPTFSDLAEIAKTGDLTKEAVGKWAEAKGLPRINPERGLGVQPFGERESLHETVIDEVKRQLIPGDAPRDKIAETLRFDNLLKGVSVDGVHIKGLDERTSTAADGNYYMTVLRAISLGAKNWSTRPVRRNFFAASITSLAEQTALMAKVSMLVRKSASVEKEIPQGVKLYTEPDSEQFLLGLANASNRMTEICRGVLEKSPDKSGKKPQIRDLKALFEGLAKLAGASRPLTPQNALWKTAGVYLEELSRKPAVTVDVFQVKERSGKVYYYQWAVTPFEATYSATKGKRKPKGLEMVFFEAWNDEIVPGGEGPVTNLQWEGRVLEGNLDKLHSIIRVPKQ
jgi:hypothetical protein